MGYSNQFFTCLNVDAASRAQVAALAEKTGIPASRLKYYNEYNIVPSGEDLRLIESKAGVSYLKLCLGMGRLDHKILEAIQKNADQISSLIEKDIPAPSKIKKVAPAFKSKLGKLYNDDCVNFSRSIPDNTVDLVFADPPFNLDKLYPSKMDDNLKTEKYIEWCQEWLSECIRVLKPGGSLFLWNLPKWNASLINFLEGRMLFRHWIAADMKYSLPIAGKLYPSHYSLLYFIKGERPNTFHPDRLPMQTCNHCFHEVKDYGGYKSKMNPEGISLTDVWLDISPVRHSKYKRRKGANELSLKLLDRIIEMATNEGDLVFDPFGGSGTTYIAAELKSRKWIGCEIGPIDEITERFKLLELEKEILNNFREPYNHLFPKEISDKRIKLGIWTPETLS